MLEHGIVFKFCITVLTIFLQGKSKAPLPGSSVSLNPLFTQWLNWQDCSLAGRKCMLVVISAEVQGHKSYTVLSFIVRKCQ